MAALLSPISSMASLRIGLCEVCLGQTSTFLFPSSSSASSSSPPHKISCGLRGGPRKPLWRGRVLSSEAIQAVQCLKLANSNSKLDHAFESRLNRLLKADLIATLLELQRQNEFDLALKVFDFLRKEVWYKPDLSLYCDMIFVVGKNKLIEKVEQLFSELQEEGLKPDTRAYSEMIGAFLQVGMVEKAMEMYTLMKESGCDPDRLTLTILIRNLEKIGEKELASSVKKDCAKYIDFPDRFMHDLERNRVNISMLKELGGTAHDSRKLRAFQTI